MKQSQGERRVGRPNSVGETERYDVRLNPEIAEWAKMQRGGLSAMIRELLQREYDKAQEAKK